MNLKLRNRVFGLSAIGAVALFLGGCTQSDPLGPEAETGEASPGGMGELIMQSLAQPSSELSVLEISSGDGLSSTKLPESTTLNAGLGKKGASSAADWDTMFNDGQYGYYYSRTTAVGLVQNDSITILWDSYAQDAIDGNESVVSVRGAREFAGGKRESWSASAVDENGAVLEGQPIGSTAHMRYETIAANGVIDVLTMSVHSGPDDDFDTEPDNRILSAHWERKAGDELIAYAKYSDADNDGILVDNGAAQPSPVDVEYYEKNPVANPFVEYRRLVVRILCDGTEDGVKSDPVVKVHGEQKYTTGRITTVAVVDSDGDSTISAGEMARFIVETQTAPQSAPVRAASFECVFNPQSGLNDASDNLYYEIHARQEKRFGWERKTSFDFTTTEPVLEGQAPASGHIELAVEYADGTSASVVADFSDGRFSGTYTNPRGETMQVSWDENGNVIE